MVTHEVHSIEVDGVIEWLPDTLKLMRTRGVYARFLNKMGRRHTHTDISHTNTTVEEISQISLYFTVL